MSWVRCIGNWVDNIVLEDLRRGLFQVLELNVTKKIRFEVSDERQSTCFSGGLASTVAKAKAKMLESFIFTGFLLLFFMSDTNRTTESVF